MPRQVRKTLGLLETNLRHPSLQTHKIQSLEGPDGGDVFEVCVQQNTRSAFHLFFCYVPDRKEDRRRIPVLTILAVTPNP